MAKNLEEAWSRVAREWVKELYDRFKKEGRTQKELGDILGLDQSGVSLLINPKSPRGTTIAILCAAGRALYKPDDEIAQVLGLEVSAGTPVPFSHEYLLRAPPGLTAYLNSVKVSPTIARQLLAIHEADKVDRSTEGWRMLAAAIEMTAPSGKPATTMPIPAPPQHDAATSGAGRWPRGERAPTQMRSPTAKSSLPPKGSVRPDRTEREVPSNTGVRELPKKRAAR